MSAAGGALSIGRVARASDVGVGTSRFCEREGLLPAPARTANGYRRYPPETVERLGLIRRAKALGFCLAKIRQLLGLSHPTGDRALVKALARHKLADLKQQCAGEGPIEGCAIIETLNASAGDD